MHLATQTLVGKIKKTRGITGSQCTKIVKRRFRSARNVNIGARIKAPAQEMKPVISTWPLMRWGMDIVGPIGAENSPKRYFLLATDYFIKWIEGETYKEIKQKNVIQFIERNIIQRFGGSAYIVTDRGPQFIGKSLNALQDKYGFKMIHSSSRYAQENGQAERSNKTIMEEIKKRVAKSGHGWYTNFSDILWAYRTTRRQPTGETPFFMAYDIEAVAPTNHYCQMKKENQIQRIPLRSNIGECNMAYIWSKHPYMNSTMK